VAAGLSHLVSGQGLAPEEPRQQLGIGRRRFRRPELGEGASEQLFHLVAEDPPCGRIEEAEPTLAVERPDQVARAFAYEGWGPVVQHGAHATGASASGFGAWSRRVRTRRPSISTTSSVRVPIGTRSPGRGSRPIWPKTYPPMVLYSVSSSASSYSVLKSEIGMAPSSRGPPARGALLSWGSYSS